MTGFVFALEHATPNPPKKSPVVELPTGMAGGVLPPPLMNVPRQGYVLITIGTCILPPLKIARQPAGLCYYNNKRRILPP